MKKAERNPYGFRSDVFLGRASAAPTIAPRALSSTSSTSAMPECSNHWVAYSPTETTAPISVSCSTVSFGHSFRPSQPSGTNLIMLPTTW